jgi:hypothetical protein
MLLINLLPLVVGAAVLPLWIIPALLLLRSEGGVLKAAAVAAGAMTVRVSQGILFGYVFDTAADTSGGESKFITSTLLLVVGILPGAGAGADHRLRCRAQPIGQVAGSAAKPAGTPFSYDNNGRLVDFRNMVPRKGHHRLARLTPINSASVRPGHLPGVIGSIKHVHQHAAAQRRRPGHYPCAGDKLALD